MLIPFTTGQVSYFLILSPSIGVLSCGCPRSVNIQPTVALLEHAWCFGHPALPSWSWRTLGSLDALFIHPGLCFQLPNVSPLCLTWVTPIPHFVCPLSSGMLFQDIPPPPPPHTSLYLHRSRSFFPSSLLCTWLRSPFMPSGKCCCHAFLLRGWGRGRRGLPLSLQPREIHSQGSQRCCVYVQWRA